MKKLLYVVRKNGFDYVLITRTETKAIYQQSFEGKTIAYEVFIVKVIKECTLAGVVIPEHEKFPSDNDFGKTAWSYKDYDSALQKYHSLK